MVNDGRCGYPEELEPAEGLRMDERLPEEGPCEGDPPPVNELAGGRPYEFAQPGPEFELALVGPSLGPPYELYANTEL